MKILLIGKSGQLAQAIATLGGQQDLGIVAYGRPDIDLTKPDSLFPMIAAEHPDCIINAAAYTNVDEAEHNRQLAFAVNATAVGEIAKAAAQVNCPLIHVSTDYVFDGQKENPYDEQDPAAPLGIYGASKRAGEIAVQDNCDRFIILRTAWVHSPFGRNFVKTMLRLAADRNEVRVVDDQLGTPTYAPHLASVIVQIATAINTGINEDSTGEPWGIYHAAGKGSASWADVAREVFQHSEALGGASANVVPISTSEYPTPAQRPANSRLNCQKLERQFSIGLPAWESGVADCVKALLRSRAI